MVFGHKAVHRNLSGPDGIRLALAGRAFGAPRYRVLYRAWLREGRRVVDATGSSVLADAVERGTGQVVCQFLTHPYLRLSTLVGTA